MENIKIKIRLGIKIRIEEEDNNNNPFKTKRGKSKFPSLPFTFISKTFDLLYLVSSGYLCLQGKTYV